MLSKIRKSFGTERGDKRLSSSGMPSFVVSEDIEVTSGTSCDH